MPAVPLQSLWSATAPAGPACAALSTTWRAQAAVIGAGYTGLSAALHLALAGQEVVVLEAADIGAGASGSNGGQVIPGVKHDPDTLEQMFGTDAGARAVATVATGPDLVFELIARHGGAAVELLSRAEVLRLTGSASYCGALLDRRGGTVQPLSYVRGLAEALGRCGGRIFTRSPALKLTRTAGAWSIETPRGSLSAPLVIVATNAYTGAVMDDLRRSVVAVPSFQVATAPIPATLRGAILPGGQAASDTRRLLRYFRLDASGRLVMGSRGTFAAVPGQRAVRHHYGAVHEIYPQVDGLAFEYHWGGLVAMTREHLPHLHELAPGLLAGLGYNGRGVAMATMMGRLLALRALGTPAAELGFPVTPLRPIPFHALSGIGARATIQYLRLADALARARSAPLA